MATKSISSVAARTGTGTEPSLIERIKGGAMNWAGKAHSAVGGFARNFLDVRHTGQFFKSQLELVLREIESAWPAIKEGMTAIMSVLDKGMGGWLLGKPGAPHDVRDQMEAAAQNRVVVPPPSSDAAFMDAILSSRSLGRAPA